MPISKQKIRCPTVPACKFTLVCVWEIRTAIGVSQDAAMGIFSA
jgi:hypothetical protein